MALDMITARKRSQGYQSPSQRPACRNCGHRSADAIRFDRGASVAYDCQLGRFFVAPGGICEQHQPAGVAGLPKKESAP